jgi:hypothetical protein
MPSGIYSTSHPMTMEPTAHAPCSDRSSERNKGQLGHQWLAFLFFPMGQLCSSEKKTFCYFL